MDRDGVFSLCLALPGAEETYPFGEEECVLVLDGELELFLGDDRHHLLEGDSATFDCRTPHRWRNPSTEQSRVLWIITPASY